MSAVGIDGTRCNKCGYEFKVNEQRFMGLMHRKYLCSSCMADRRNEVVTSRN